MSDYRRKRKPDLVHLCREKDVQIQELLRQKSNVDSVTKAILEYVIFNNNLYYTTYIKHKEHENKLVYREMSSFLSKLYTHIYTQLRVISPTLKEKYERTYREIT